jgi:DNA-binding NarL/FixJ family response regulator
MEPATEHPIRVVIVEDHVLVAEALEATFAQVPDLVVEATASTLADGLSAVEATQPDVVVMNVQLPDGDGASGTSQIVTRSPTTRVLIVSAHGSIDVVARAIEAGAVGFVPKTGNLRDLVSAVRRAARGAMVLRPDLLREVANHLRNRPPPVGTDLTLREREVLAHLSRGVGPDAIAADLAVSPHTVRNHVRALRRKLGASSQLEAVAIAYRAGLVQPDAE